VGNYANAVAYENPAAAEEAVLLFIRFPEDRSDAWERCCDLEGRLAEEIYRTNAGEYDGYDFGQGKCIFYFYGSDARLLYHSVSGVIQAFGPPPKSYVRIRFGGPGAPEERIEFN
jgi:hypothetical protein